MVADVKKEAQKILDRYVLSRRLRRAASLPRLSEVQNTAVGVPKGRLYSTITR